MGLSYLFYGVKGWETTSKAPSCSQPLSFCEVRRFASVLVFLALLCQRECFPSGLSFSWGLAEWSCSHWVWCRTDQWLWDEIWAFQLFKSRNSFMVFLVSLFCFFSKKIKKIKRFFSHEQRPTFKKRAMLPLGWAWACFCWVDLSEGGLGSSRWYWKDLDHCFSNFKGHKDHLRVLLNPDSGSVALGWDTEVSISKQLSGDGADAGQWTTLCVTRLDDPN